MERRKRELRGAVAALIDGCTDREVLVEGPAGTGKSHGDLAYIHSCCWRYPKSRHLICRATRVSMTESLLKTWEEQILGDNHPAYSGNAGRANRHSYDFPNGSTVVVGGLDNPEKLFSTEWDTVLVGEASEVSLDDWEKLGRAMRNNRMPYQQRIAETNPAFPAHWLNKRADSIDETLRLVETPDQYNALQEYNAAPRKSQMRRLVSKHQDNPAYWDITQWRWTAFGESYVIGELSGMSGHRRARLFEGRWVSAEGSVFGAEFSETRNIIDAFLIPNDWPIWFYLDPGYDHPTGAFWVAVSPTGKRFIIDEIYERQADVQRLSAMIRERERKRSYKPIRRYLDPRYGFSRTAFARNGTTIAEQFDEEGLKFYPWPALAGEGKDAGVNATRRGFTSGGLIFFRRCVNGVQESQSWSYKRTATGELPTGDDQYEDKNNHIMDPLIAMEVTAHKFEDMPQPPPEPGVAAYPPDEEEPAAE